MVALKFSENVKPNSKQASKLTLVSPDNPA